MALCLSAKEQTPSSRFNSLNSYYSPSTLPDFDFVLTTHASLHSASLCCFELIRKQHKQKQVSSSTVRENHFILCSHPCYMLFSVGERRGCGGLYRFFTQCKFNFDMLSYAHTRRKFQIHISNFTYILLISFNNFFPPSARRESCSTTRLYPFRIHVMSLYAVATAAEVK